MPSYGNSPYNLAQIAYGRQSQPQLQKRIDKLNLAAPVLSSKKNTESAQIPPQNETSDALLQKRSLELLNSNAIANKHKIKKNEEKIYAD